MVLPEFWKDNCAWYVENRLWVGIRCWVGQRQGDPSGSHCNNTSGRWWFQAENREEMQALTRFCTYLMSRLSCILHDKKKRSPGWFCLKDEFATSWDTKDREKSIFGEKEITNFDGRCVKCQVPVPISEYMCWVARTETLKIRSRVRGQRCNSAPQQEDGI